MVKLIKEKNKVIYVCGECEFKYEDEKWAKKCENWCKKYKSCNIKIIKHAIK